MALYMDVHNSLPEGATAADIAGAHAADLQIQEGYGVRYLNYWVDEKGSKVFCLVEAPNADAAHAVHREAHGLVADEILPGPGGVSMEAHEVGAAFLEALTNREYEVARALLVDDVRFRMLLPSGLMTESDADATIGRFIGWFGDADGFEVEDSNSGEVEGRAAITYRFRLHDADGWQAIEQHLMLDVGEDARIEVIDLLCSGFRSIAVNEPGPVQHFDAGNLGCADGLAGEFRRRMQQIPLGHVLIVSTRDPAAKEDLPPLARMMGHVVRSVEAPGDGRLLVSVERGR